MELLETIREKFNLSADGAIFSIECKENYELIRELTNFDDLKVLSPERIVNAVKERISKLHKTYF